MATPDSLTLVQDFMNALARRFTEFTSASYIGAFLTDDNFRISEFGSTGFKMDYFEEDYLTPGGWVPANQVRHAVGGLIAGYVRGEDAALAQLNGREERSDLRHGLPDINLNNMTVPYGARIRDPLKGYSYAKHLGSWIRETLCQQYGQ